jgi:hypothetical protein
MVITEISEDTLLKVFAPEDREWHTARELQRLLEERGYRISLEELMGLADDLAKKGYLDVNFTEPKGQGRTGFVTSMTLEGRIHRRGIS